MTTGEVSVEVCVEDAAGVRAARAAGARSVELCSALSEGGLTPSRGLQAAALAALGIEVVVLVRPRAGDFLYDADELAVMEHDVDDARALGAAGVALGCLDAEGAVDAERLARLVERARPLAVTFHRAFDLVREPERELETLVRLGVARVLTSGLEATAREGCERIAAFVRVARGRIQVVAAGGVRPENVEEIVRATGVRAVHLSGAVGVASAMQYRNPRPRLRSCAVAGDESAHRATDAALVRALVARLASSRPDVG